ncbi:glycoside hydrolase [Serendipita vermifera]|nr:glycoside hydrolase [Serendipita vermifera]
MSWFECADSLTVGLGEFFLGPSNFAIVAPELRVYFSKHRRQQRLGNSVPWDLWFRHPARLNDYSPSAAYRMNGEIAERRSPLVCGGGGGQTLFTFRPSHCHRPKFPWKCSSFDSSLCPDGVTCAKNCALDGADYSGTYGITTSGSALTLKFKTGSNVGSRVYLMANDSTYQIFKLKNQEFTFDVDMSNLGCGLNGALYFVEMDADGGKSKFANNKAGAKYGTGYCDSQCPHDIKFINGEANVDGWASSPNDPNAGKGKYGTCCSEMDIWEANKYASAYTPHGCTVTGQTRCEGNDCGDGSNRYGGVCDKDGCDFNSYRMGDTSFLGPGSTVDTTKKLTVVTQFITSDGTANGALTEIRRLYVQNGKVISNSKTNIAGMAAYDSITAEFCDAQKTAFGDHNDFANKGGFSPMDASMTRVLNIHRWNIKLVSVVR